MEKAIGPNSAQRRAAMRAEAHNVAWAAAGPRVHFWRIGGFFCKNIWEREVDCGLIRIKLEGFFAKRPRRARSRPFMSPIRRPRKVGDVATLAGLLLVRESFFRDEKRRLGLFFDNLPQLGVKWVDGSAMRELVNLFLDPLSVFLHQTTATGFPRRRSLLLPRLVLVVSRHSRR